VPTFSVDAPDGKTYKVDGPSDATHEQIAYAVYLQMHRQPEQPQTSTAGTLLHGAERGVGPMAAGMAGAGYGAGLGTAVLPGIGTVVGGVLGAGIAAWAANKAQDKALESMPKVAKAIGVDEAQREAEAKEHPIASVIGDVAPQLLAMRPSVTNLSRAFSTAEKFAARHGETIEEAAKAINEARKFAAINATIGGVQNAAQQGMSDQPVDWASVGESALLGGLLTKPTRVGSALYGVGERLAPGYAARHPAPPPAPPPKLLTHEPNVFHMGQETEPTPPPPGPPPQLTYQPGAHSVSPEARAFPEQAPQQPNPQQSFPFEWAGPEAPKPPPPFSPVTPPIHQQGELGLNQPKQPEPQPVEAQGDLFNKGPRIRPEVSVPEGPAPTQVTLPFEPGSKMEPTVRGQRKQAVLNFIKQTPATRDEVQTSAGIGSATEVIGHLNTLKREGLIQYDPDAKKWMLKPEEKPSDQPRQKRSGIGDQSTGLRVGMDVPVPQRPPEVTPPLESITRGVVPDTTNVTGNIAREGPAPAPIERDPEHQIIKRRAIIAFHKGNIDENQLMVIKSELDDPNPDFKHLHKMLDAATGAKDYQRLALIRKAFANKAPSKPAEVTKLETDEDRQVREYNEQANAREAKQKTHRKDEEDTALRQGTSTGGMSKDTAQKIVDEHTKNWKNAPKIEVHETRPDNKPEDTTGWHDHGAVHLVADQHANPEELKATLFHEALGHYGLRSKFGDFHNQLMQDIYKSNPAMQEVADRWIKNKGGHEFYKNMTPEQLQARAVDEVLANASEQGPIKNTGIRAAFNRVIAAVRQFIRQHLSGSLKYSDNDVTQILRQAHENVLDGHARKVLGVGDKEDIALKQKTVKEPYVEPKTIEDIEKTRTEKTDKLYKNAYSRPGVIKSVGKMLGSHEGREEMIRLLQNYRRPLDILEKNINAAGGNADIGSFASSLSAKAEMENKNNIQMISTQRANIGKLAQKLGMTQEQVEKRLQSYALALHEKERRHTLYTLDVPLENTKKFMLDGQNATAADHRDRIVKKYNSDKTIKDPQQLAKDRQLLEQLLVHADIEGHTSIKRGPKSMLLDENSLAYNVAGKYSRNAVKIMENTLAQDRAKTGDLIDKIIDTHQQLAQEARRLNQKAGYESPQATNWIGLYNWKHYMPLKGDPTAHKNTDRFDFDGKALGGAVSERAEAFGGRRSDADNPFIQTMADALKAGFRSGRDGFTSRLAKLIDDGHIPGRKVAEVKFEDRADKLEKYETLKNHFFNYQKDGTIEVYKISTDTAKGKAMNEAIRGFNNDIAAPYRFLNAVTGGIGQLHTRFNVAFPPYNFVRHAITSSMMVGMENDPILAAKFVGSITSKILDGGLFKAARVASLFHNNDMAGIEKLANASPNGFYGQLHDWLENGGRATWTQAHNIQSQRAELARATGPKGFMSSLDHVKQYFNIWSDMFEFASRAAGYGVIKNHYNELAKAKGEAVDTDDIKLRATQYTKNLFNFSTVGKYGREVGSAFMFLRPAMTTAVRSIDALSPSFLSMDKAVKRMVQETPSLGDVNTVARILAKQVKSKEITPEIMAQAKAKVDQNIENFKKVQLGKQKAARVMAVGMMGAGYGLYTMAMLAGEEDDQGRNKVATDNMSMWARNIRLPAHGMLGKGNDYFQIPWGWGLGTFGAFGAQMAAATIGESNLKEVLGNMIPIALESYFPLPVEKYSPIDHPIAFTVASIMPTFARPFIEYGMNVDAFGREVYTNRMNQFGDAYSGGENLPELYGAATRMLADATGNTVNISPNTLHFFTNSYIDGLARLAHNTYGTALTITGQKDFDPKRDVGGILDSFIGKSSSYDAREFADIRTQIQRQQNTLAMYKDRPEMLDKYLDTHPNAIMIDNLYNAVVNGQLKTVQHQLRVLEDDTSQSSKDKADEITDLKLQRNWLMRSFIDQVRDYD